MYVNTVLINKHIKFLLAVGMNGCIKINISGACINITITNYIQLVFVDLPMARARNDRVQATKRISTLFRISS